VGSRAVLDAVVKRKIPNSRRESNPRNPVAVFKTSEGGEAHEVTRSPSPNSVTDESTGEPIIRKEA